MEDWPLRSPIDATSDSVEKFSNAVTRVLRIRPIRSTSTNDADRSWPSVKAYPDAEDDLDLYVCPRYNFIISKTG
ncbi:hypothetical protein sscle_04g039200 [Sclerotinia sclerotiorum 1980 UF-70]|uniref:Uncharacterized protein n=1 Tax=Sclerotinia sclerotiorum (strain ATCC 18683 / 1980 / Ss-1) TaxID=665079 RepID=A0A1D9Q2G3_SCLS1|nr:hypothetical protein sscle_04g039200 [Sclerotinia sclerotiorum 1980 UF-70]